MLASVALLQKTLRNDTVVFERKYGKRFSLVFAVVGRKVSDRYTTLRAAETAVEENLPRLLKESYTDLMRDVGSHFGRRQVAYLRGLKGKDEFDEWDPYSSTEMAAWIQKHLATRITAITRYTLEAIRSYINEALESGRDPSEIARNLRKLYAFSSDRAKKIAKTEVNSAHNAATHFVTGQFMDPDVLDKSWLSASDKRVRKSHAAANGQRRAYDKPFRVGTSKLLFPGDTSLNAEGKEIVGCRCTVLYSRKRSARR